jgi:hypothetical protein
MPRRCSVCVHENRQHIDSALLSGASLRDIAGRYDLSKSALERHKADHLPAHLAQARAAAEVARADDLLSQVNELQLRTLNILGIAESTGELRVALNAISQARGNLELLARLLGELSGTDGTTVNVLVSPEWARIRTAMVKALAPYPEARSAVAASLLELETS